MRNRKKHWLSPYDPDSGYQKDDSRLVFSNFYAKPKDHNLPMDKTIFVEYHELGQVKATAKKDKLTIVNVVHVQMKYAVQFKTAEQALLFKMKYC